MSKSYVIGVFCHIPPSRHVYATGGKERDYRSFVFRHLGNISSILGLGCLLVSQLLIHGREGCVFPQLTLHPRPTSAASEGNPSIIHDMTFWQDLILVLTSLSSRVSSEIIYLMSETKTWLDVMPHLRNRMYQAMAASLRAW
jgi:hypothetical protein